MWREAPSSALSPHLVRASMGCPFCVSSLTCSHPITVPITGQPLFEMVNADCPAGILDNRRRVQFLVAGTQLARCEVMTIPLHACEREMRRIVERRSRDGLGQFVDGHLRRLAIDFRTIDFLGDEGLAQ